MDDDVWRDLAAREPCLSIPLGIVDNVVLQGVVDNHSHLEIEGMKVEEISYAITARDLSDDLSTICLKNDPRRERMRSLHLGANLVHDRANPRDFHSRARKERDEANLHQVGEAKR